MIDNKSKHQLVGNNCKAMLNGETDIDLNFKLNGVTGISKAAPLNVKNKDAAKETQNPREGKPESVAGFVPRSRFVKYRRGLPGNEGSGPGRPGGRLDINHRNRHFLSDDANTLCGIVFVKKPFTAKILFQVLNVSNTDAIITFIQLKSQFVY